jgi:hypothetical protein
MKNTAPTNYDLESGKMQAEVESILKQRGFDEPLLIFSMETVTGIPEVKYEVPYMPDTDTSTWKLIRPDFKSVFAEGKVRFICDNFGERRYTGSVIYHNPMWADLLVEAELCLRDSGDRHHVFLECCDKSPTISSDGTQYYFMAYGS